MQPPQGAGLKPPIGLGHKDLRAGQVKVAKPRVAVRYQVHVSEPKTLKGKRWLALDPGTAAALREHRTRQAEERLMVGPGWVDSGLDRSR